MSEIALVAVIAITALALFGWYAEYYVVLGTGATATMKANAALALLMSSATLLFVRHRNTLRASAVVVFCIGGISAAEYVVGSLGIDELIVRDKLFGPLSPHPGRMAPQTAVGIMSIAGAMWHLAGESIRFAKWASAVVSIIGSLGIVGYALSIDPLIQPHHTMSGMALPTAIAFMLLGFASLDIAVRLASKRKRDYGNTQ